MSPCDKHQYLLRTSFEKPGASMSVVPFLHDTTLERRVRGVVTLTGTIPERMCDPKLLPDGSLIGTIRRRGGGVYHIDSGQMRAFLAPQFWTWKTRTTDKECNPFVLALALSIRRAHAEGSIPSISPEIFVLILSMLCFEDMCV